MQQDALGTVSWSSLPRKDQLAILCLLRLSEPIVKISIVTYIYYQLQFLDPALTSADIIKQSAFLQTSYTVTQCLSSLFWGSVADSPRGGRKFVILFSLSGSLISSSLLGFVTSFHQILLLRCIEGLTNGNVAMVRAMVSEVVQEKRFQPRAFVLLPICTGIATVLGPLVAGLTAEVGTNARDGFFQRWPYALPGLVNAGFLLFVLLTVVLFLEETSEPLRASYDPGIAFSRKMCSLFSSCWRGGGARRGREASYQPIASEGGDEEDVTFTTTRPSAEMPESKEASAYDGGREATSDTAYARLPTRRIFTKNMLLALLASVLFEAHLNNIAVTMPNFLADPVASAEEQLAWNLPIRFGGGCGFRPRSLSWYQGIFGMIVIPTQILAYPRLSQHFGWLKLWRWCCFVFPLLWLCYPYLATVPSTTPAPGEKTGAAVWTCLVLLQGVMGVLTSFTAPAQLLLTNLSSPHPSALARTHSVSFFLTMATRAATSTAAGITYAYGSTHTMSGLAFWCSSAVAAVLVLLTPFIKEGSGHEIRLPGEEEVDKC